ncbi:MAG: HAD-superfamily hydrolase, subfamily variant 1 [Pelosinus sp.]|nr:HAD-superfamily hydrolase, subfamily variant 1 [Pelosinus sp.]
MIYKAVLFDLDGTVLDTSDLIVSSFIHTFQKHYKRELALSEIHAFFGKTLRAAMEYLGPDKVEELIQTYREYSLTHHDQMITIFSGVIETIQALYEAGIMMAIVTSKTKKTTLRGLKLFDLDKYFSVIIGADQCQNHKPHPEPIQNALLQLQIRPEECLMVGDSPFDLISARQAGVKTVAVRWTRVSWETIVAEKPDYILEDMYGLLPLCEIQ